MNNLLLAVFNGTIGIGTHAVLMTNFCSEFPGLGNSNYTFVKGLYFMFIKYVLFSIPYLFIFIWKICILVCILCSMLYFGENFFIIVIKVTVLHHIEWALAQEAVFSYLCAFALSSLVLKFGSVISSQMSRLHWSGIFESQGGVMSLFSKHITDGRGLFRCVFILFKFL